LLLVAFPAVALFVRERPRRARVESVLAEGLTLGEGCAVIASGLRLPAMLFAAAAINGTIAHIVPILTDRGIAAGTATTAVAAAGLSLIIENLARNPALQDGEVSRSCARPLFLAPTSPLSSSWSRLSA
jgi:hypothetical protein